jgi:hypothetical protein
VFRVSIDNVLVVSIKFCESFFHNRWPQSFPVAYLGESEGTSRVDRHHVIDYNGGWDAEYVEV